MFLLTSPASAWLIAAQQGADGALLLAAAVLIALHVTLIVLLLAQRASHRRAEQSALEQEAELRASDGRARQLAGRLIAAEESERRRIARDLHDGLCQEIAGVSVALSHLKRRRGEVQDEEVQRIVAALQQRTKYLAESVRVLSHHLHPSVLQHVGLVAAVEGLCVESERQHGVQVLFNGGDWLGRLEFDIELCLFRITQEALRNAFTHGGAQRASVSITKTGDLLDLTVVDDGKGFDVNLVRQNGGLGLLSIEERARLIGGELKVTSYERRGTIVQATIPLSLSSPTTVRDQVAPALQSHG
jgi:two-component system sensor histidine kinase UhpB